jgi:hypothetical protein
VGLHIADGFWMLQEVPHWERDPEFWFTGPDLTQVAAVLDRARERIHRVTSISGEELLPTDPPQRTADDPRGFTPNYVSPPTRDRDGLRVWADTKSDLGFQQAQTMLRAGPNRDQTERPRQGAAGASVQVRDPACSWAGAGSNRRPSTFQADARTN